MSVIAKPSVALASESSELAAVRPPAIRFGVGGWTYEPWRGSFYPPGLAQKRELEFASRKLTSIEINGTYYGSQKPASFAKWHDETPEDFIFSLKGPRFTTNRRSLAEAGSSIERFFASGVMALKAKLGPINWQFMPTKKFAPADFEAFFRLLPDRIDGQAIRHVVEVRHDSFKTPDFVALARQYHVGIVLAADSPHPLIADPTAPFVYARLMGTTEAEPAGYAPDALATWVTRARAFRAGEWPAELPTFGPPPVKQQKRDVFLYVIGGFKARNPMAAMAMIERLSQRNA
jgi:uncharacterized protein YecE (DUF72 family)